MTPGAVQSLIEVSHRLITLLGQAAEENTLLLNRIAALESDSKLAAKASALRTSGLPCAPSMKNPLGQCPHDTGCR